MARSFNGSTDAIQTSASFNNASPAVTSSVWFKYTSSSNAYNTIMIHGDSNHFSQILLKSTGHLAYYVNLTPSGVNLDPGTAATSSGTWYHAALTYDTTNGLLTYLNGVSDGTTANSNAILAASTKVNYGQDPANSGRQFTGSIADGAEWNVTLSAGEILALAKGARPFQIRPSSLTFYHPLDGLQSPEPDLSGFARNGTLTGTALAAGPPLMMFTPRWPQFIPSSANTFNPAWALGRNQFIEGFAS